MRVSDSVNRVTRFIKVFGKERIFIFALLASARKNDLKHFGSIYEVFYIDSILYRSIYIENKEKNVYAHVIIIYNVWNNVKRVVSKEEEEAKKKKKEEIFLRCISNELAIAQGSELAICQMKFGSTKQQAIIAM